MQWFKIFIFKQKGNFISNKIITFQLLIIPKTSSSIDAVQGKKTAYEGLLGGKQLSMCTLIW